MAAKTQERVTLEGLWAELARVRVLTCSLRDPEFHLDGMQVGRIVYIDERPAIVETLLHELIHSRFPSMSERAVLRASRKLLQTMTDAELRKWWTAYKRVRKIGRPVELGE